MWMGEEQKKRSERGNGMKIPNIPLSVLEAVREVGIPEKQRGLLLDGAKNLRKGWEAESIAYAISSWVLQQPASCVPI